MLMLERLFLLSRYLIKHNIYLRIIVYILKYIMISRYFRKEPELILKYNPFVFVI